VSRAPFVHRPERPVSALIAAGFLPPPLPCPVMVTADSRFWMLGIGVSERRELWQLGCVVGLRVKMGILKPHGCVRSGEPGANARGRAP
jgi:hypothetical protein